MPPTPPRFNAGAVRDVLGLVRLLWSSDQSDPSLERRKRAKALLEIGKTLAETLTLGRLPPESLGYKAALWRSAEALETLIALEWSGDLSEVIRLARDRVRGPTGKREDDRDLKRKAQEARR